MKKIISLISATAFAFVLAACSFLSLSENDYDQKIAENAKSGITLSLVDGYASRTALPGYDFAQFFYELYGSTDGGNTFVQLGTADSKGVITRKAFSYFYDKDNPPIFALPAKDWIFRLDGFATNDSSADTKPVISGTSSSYDLSTGYKKVLFRMYPCKNLKGSGEVTLTFPASTVTTVKAALSDNPVASEASLSTETLVIKNGTSVVFTKSDLDSAVTKYARFFLYDSNGDSLCDLTESIIVAGGLTSKSTIALTADDFHKFSVVLTVTKDGSPWTDCPYEVILKDTATLKEYTLAQGADGQFTSSVPEGTFKVVLKASDGTKTDCDITVDSRDKAVSAAFGTVIIPDGAAVVITPCASPDNQNVVKVNETTFIMKSDSGLKAEVTLKPGYGAVSDTDGDGKKDVKIAGQTVNVGETFEIPAGTTVAASDISGTEVLTYTITYSGYGTWTDGYTAPSSYTVENYTTVILPVLSNVKPKTENGKTYVLDGWTCNGTVYAKITAGTTGNLELEAKWKETVQTEKSDGSDPDVAGTIYANGINLIIEWNSTQTETYVYVDLDNDGVFDTANGDYQLTDSDGNKDYSDYILKASDIYGNCPASDFTFTMRGGKIASLVGLGKDKPNISTVNISGYCILGNKNDIGIDLPSLTNECVNIVGQMENSYSITLLSGNKFDRDHDYYRVAYINKAEYAQMAKFKCLYKETSEELSISVMNVTEDGMAKKIIYLSDPEPIGLPDKDDPNSGITYIEVDGVVSETDFTLGENAKIQIPCSVFSISVENGTFELQQTAMKDESGATIATTNLGQTGESTYQTSLATDTDYLYMHMFSKSNEINAETASTFLQSVIFKKKDKDTDIVVHVNLETVPYEDIQAMKNKYGEQKFSYFNGSFYAGVTRTTDWITCYNAAKSTQFNGLNGYLLTITSAVENNYIYKQMGMEKCWIGGSRMIPKDGIYDASTYSIKTENDTKNGTTNKFIWQCGPEAGMWFQDGKVTSTSITNRTGYSKTTANIYTNWETNEPNNSWAFSSNQYPETTVQFHSNGQWNDLKYNTDSSDYRPTGYIIEFSPYETTYGLQKANYSSVTLYRNY